MTLEIVLYVTFALLSTAGMYLIAAHFHSRRLGVVLALLTLTFFVALAAWLRWMVTTYGA